MTFLQPSINDIIDILLVSFVLYRAILAVSKAKNYHLVLSLILIAAAYFLASIFKLKMISSFMSKMRDLWIIALIVIFHPEIRTFLAKFSLEKTFSDHNHKKRKKTPYNPILKSLAILQMRKIGALLVFEANFKLDDYIRGGEFIDAAISDKLILSLFHPRSQLHDGAVIISNNRIIAAKVVLPLSTKITYSQEYGTRHLAAVGITEDTDAFVIVASEETGALSFAHHGELSYNLSVEEIAQRINDAKNQ